MTLFIDRRPPRNALVYPDRVLLNLRQLASLNYECGNTNKQEPQTPLQANDPVFNNLTRRRSPENNEIDEVFYTPPPQDVLNDSAIHGTMNFLANQRNETILIAGFDNSVDLRNFAGNTFCETDAGSTIFRIWYDTSQADGRGYFVIPDPTQPGQNIHNPIAHPNLFILGRELVKAAAVLSDGVQCLGSLVPNQVLEDRGTTGENFFRAEKNCLKRFFEDTEVIVGRRIADPPPPNKPEEDGCFIVTAASGSIQSNEVLRFKTIRDKYLRSTFLGDQFFIRLFAEYSAFSPKVAQDLERSTELKNWVNSLIVNPLLLCFSIFESSVDDRDSITLKTSIEEYISTESLRYQFTLEDIDRILLAILDIKRRLKIEPTNRNQPKQIASQKPKIHTMISTLAYLQNSIELNCPETEFIQWAIIDPLHIYWLFRKEYKESTNSSKNGETLIALLRESIEEWLLSVPFPVSLDQMPQEQLESDLAYLADTILIRPSLRSKFGRRLMKEFSTRVEYNLKAVLDRYDYSPI